MARKRITNSEPVATGTSAARATTRGSRVKHSAKTSVPASEETLSSTEMEPTAAASMTEPTAARTASGAVDTEEVARLAFSYWQARGCQGGSPEEDWFRAEQEVRNRSLAAQTA